MENCELIRFTGISWSSLGRLPHSPTPWRAHDLVSVHRQIENLDCCSRDVASHRSNARTQSCAVVRHCLYRRLYWEFVLLLIWYDITAAYGGHLYSFVVGRSWYMTRCHCLICSRVLAIYTWLPAPTVIKVNMFVDCVSCFQNNFLKMPLDLNVDSEKSELMLVRRATASV